MRKWVAAALLAAGVASLAMSQSPRRRPMQADFRPAPIAASSAINSVKLVESAGVNLLFSEQEGPLGAALFRARLNGGASQREAIGPLSSMMDKPGWDAASDGPDSFSVVVTVPGSAVSALELKQTRGGERIKVNRATPFGVFGAPHFVEGGPGAISSVAIIGGETLIALFPREGGGEFGAYRKLPAPGEGVLQDARLIRAGDGYLLFTKTMVPGAAFSARRSPSGEVTFAGVIHAMRLDAEMRKKGDPSRPLGEQLILEFDAAAHGNGAAVFATTAKGYVLAAGSMPDGVFGAGSWVEQAHARPLSSPSILAVGDKLHLAAIESEERPDGRIVTAIVP